MEIYKKTDSCNLADDLYHERGWSVNKLPDDISIIVSLIQTAIELGIEIGTGQNKNLILTKLIEQGIIEPIEVPTWTDSQMIEFAKFAREHPTYSLEAWLKSKQEEGK